MISEITRERMRVAHTGKKHSDETKAKLKSARNNPNRPKLSEEARMRIRIGNTGIKRSDEFKQHLREINTGKILSEEHRKKLSNSHKGIQAGDKHPLYGKPMPEAVKKKLSCKLKGDNAPNWKGGISFEPYCPKFNKAFKDRVRKFFNYTCVECGKRTIDTRKNLHVHHVNYDKQTCCNSVIPLFVALCHSCHSKTQFNREYWQQHFTDIIYSKYNGRCY